MNNPTNKSEQLFARLKKNRLIALLTPESAAQCVSCYERLNSLGITLEIALRSKIALEGIKTILKKHSNALILAGTVMTKKQAESAISAGAAGVVSADYIPEVVETCVPRDIMCIPGGLSDAGKQLVHKAQLLGYDLERLRKKVSHQWIYKLFPAIAGGKSNVEIASAWRGPFKGLTIVYTGGVTLDNLPRLNQADPEGIFCASALTQYAGKPRLLEKEAKRWIDILHNQGKKPHEIPAKRKTTDRTKVVTFGEIMLRLSTPDNQRFLQTNVFDVHFGGAEANVAVSLANFGLHSCYVTALPNHEIGQSAVNALRSYSVDTQYIQRTGERIGIYFLETGASQRPSKVIYDRLDSAFSQLKPGQFDWDHIFRDACWFHWSGITPALSDTAPDVILEALKSAKRAGITVSVDLNYRAKLWPPEKACLVMTHLMKYVDVCIGNEEDAEKIFGIKTELTDMNTGIINPKAYKKVAQKLTNRFGFQLVVITLRKSISASDNLWSACLYDGKAFFQSKEYSIHVIDRVGSGDAFSSGFIYAKLKGKSNPEALEFGTAASCLKQTIHGDFNLASVEEIEKIVAGKTGGRIQR